MKTMFALRQKEIVMKSVAEYIASEIPSSKYVRGEYVKRGIFLDTRDETFLCNLKVAHKLKDNKYSDRLKAMKLLPLKVGSFVYCGEEHYGVGRVTQMFSEDLMLVLFNSRTLPLTCNRKTMRTVHSNSNYKIKLIL